MGFHLVLRRTFKLSSQELLVCLFGVAGMLTFVLPGSILQLYQSQVGEWIDGLHAMDFI
jgi:hypothetical protein